MKRRLRLRGGESISVVEAGHRPRPFLIEVHLRRV
jgi:hypothetical protein